MFSSEYFPSKNDKDKELSPTAPVQSHTADSEETDSDTAKSGSSVMELLDTDVKDSDTTDSEETTSDTAGSDETTSDTTGSGETTSDTAGSEETTSGSAGLGTISFEPDNFIKNTVYMGKGMLGIFVAITVIVIVMTVLGKIKTKKAQ